MARPAARPPVILLGMHRSGTSMVARLLERLGLFVGWRKQGDHEALFFVALDNWLLEQAGGRWDHPEPVRDLIGEPAVRALAVDYLRLSLRSPRALSFLGPRRTLRYRTPEALAEPWGFKDPRATFTLPLWLDVFPQARVVHVMRHGVDVAESLRRRHERILAARAARYRRLRGSYRLRAKRAGFTTSVRCADLGRGFALWQSYVAEGRRAVASVGERGFSLRFEELLAAPADPLAKLAEFCELAAPRERVEALAREVVGERALAYRQDPGLVRFAERHAEALETQGY
jgi:hypothetical protein